MDEVMVYIKNILLDEKDEILNELIIMENIKKETDLFQDIKINMSLKEIMDNYETVIFKILSEKSLKQNVMKI